MNKRNSQNNLVRAIKKFFYSAFVGVTFIAYALQNHGATAVSGVSVANGTNSNQGGSATTTSGTTATGSTTVSGSTASAGTNTTVSSTTGGYKNGTYTGPAVNIRWGTVQVQATIQNGQITNVQFLQYPNERNTSVRINSYAVPTLQQEAIQAQSANVNFVTGATLTSEGFQQSLQAALTQAKS